jgi:predicted membrane chloride channel (bestrophin family)
MYVSEIFADLGMVEPYRTPAVCLLASVGFFGLDQVGAELEGPFGTDANDFPILKMGHSLCNDLDAIMRTVRREQYIKRLQLNSEEKRIAKATAENMGWL